MISRFLKGIVDAVNCKEEFQRRRRPSFDIMSSFSDILTLRWLIKNIQVDQFKDSWNYGFKIPVWKL